MHELEVRDAETDELIDTVSLHVLPRQGDYLRLSSVKGVRDYQVMVVRHQAFTREFLETFKDRTPLNLALLVK